MLNASAGNLADSELVSVIAFDLKYVAVVKFKFAIKF